MFVNSQSTLKCRYERFIVALEEATKDTLPFLKEKALKVREQPHVFCSFEAFFNFNRIVGMVRVDPELSCPRLPIYIQKHWLELGDYLISVFIQLYLDCTTFSGHCSPQWLLRFFSRGFC